MVNLVYEQLSKDSIGTSIKQAQMEVSKEICVH